MHYNLGNALLQKGDADQAIAQFQQALAAQPGLAAAHFQLGNVLLGKGRIDDAVAQYQKALATQPDFVDAHLNLASALLQKGRVQEVVAHCRAALKLQPDNLQTLSNLAWVLATWSDASVRNGAEAIELARRANQLWAGKEPLAQRALAAAYAETGNFSEAIAAARQALKLATDQGDTYFAWYGPASTRVPSSFTNSVPGTFWNSGYLYPLQQAGDGNILFCPDRWGTGLGADYYLPLLTADSSGILRSSYAYNPRVIQPGVNNQRLFQKTTQMEPRKLFAVDYVDSPPYFAHAREWGWNVLLTDGGVHFSRNEQAYQFARHQQVSYDSYFTTQLFNSLELDH